jgi:NAD(P)-dependent dehydrogenase (short-subunit alcohol dehydrogenase family)
MNGLKNLADLHFFVHCRSQSLAINNLQSDLGDRMVLHFADLEDEVAVIKMASKILSICENPSIFLHFAAPPLEFHRFKESSTKSFQAAFSVQTLAATTVLRSLLPKMKNVHDNLPAHVVFILSEVVCGTPPKGMAEYVVGKYAMLGLMRALSAEFVGQKIYFHAITPGMMDTKFIKHVPEIVVETARKQRAGGLQSVKSVASKLLTLINDPDKLIGDAIYLR